LVGRFAAHDVVVDGEVFVSAGELISEEVAQKISAAEVEEVTIRSPLACETRYGICRKCYGVDLATDELVEIGAAVGIMAAQSIGEPGTQLTLRTRHVGGIITAKDVTQGLPRVEEIFEARVPKDPALMAPFAGRVEIIEKGENERILRIKNTDKDGVPPEVEFELDPLAELTVEDGDLVGQGAELTKGFLDPEEILDVLGKPAAQKYLLKEVQKVYSSQGVALADKHIEVIIRQMLNKVRIESPGGTDFMPGEVVSEFSFAAANEKARAAGKDPATGETIVLGITKASLATESFLAAASFINTTRVLTEASLSGRVDHLRGLKENVIIGRLIPTGERARLLGKDEDADD
jgi:DNA-directed RNA polymerase subunit beta'